MKSEVIPFENCPALDGYHCITNSLAKIFHYNRCPLSEDMLLGLGAGMGFIYRKIKFGSTSSIFIGGRGNNKDFFTDLGKRLGVKINSISTSSAPKAESTLLGLLKSKTPIMMFGDMGFLPWFDFPEEYHFGGHSFVICGFDGKETVLGSDMDQKSSGLKKGFYYPISLNQLAKARNSSFKPFPPKNTRLDFDFSNFHQPKADDIYSAIDQCIDMQMNPPIKNIGIKGIRFSSKEILNWPEVFNDYDLRMNLFCLYIYLEIGGTGGGCFRYMYSRFLKEAATICRNKELIKPAERIFKTGELFTQIALLFQKAETLTDLKPRIIKASEIFKDIADIEEEAYSELVQVVR